MRGSILGLILLASFATLHAQIGYPGGSPFPGGSPYPGGNPYPGGGRGRNPNGGNGGAGRDSGRPARGKKEAPATVTTTGMLRLVAGSQFVLEADDHRIITFSTTDNTKVQKDGKTIDLKALAVADHLTVDSTADEDGYFTAATVVFNLAGTAGDREAAARTWDLPTLAERKAAARASSVAGTNKNSSGGGSRDDDDRPVLRRKSEDGGQASDAAASSAPANHSDPAADPATPSASAVGVPASSAASSPAAAPVAQQPQDIADDRPKTEMRPNDPPPDADDPGKPELRRGRPATRARAASSDDDAPGSLTTPSAVAAVSAGAPSVGSISGSAASAAQPAPKFADAAPGIIRIEEDPVIVKAKDAAAEYAGTLPDFFCRQVTTRYETDNPKSGWQALDTVTADLAYKDGHESYENIKVGNKAVNTGMDQIPGSSSSGEFASILQDLFEPSTGASFRKGGQDTLRGRASTTFKFEVKRENSHWRVGTGGQLYYPAYRGTVWIDRGTSRVTRIEMESRNMPVLFPFEKVETAVDYDFVRLSTPQEFLMPVEAEVLSCEESSSRCVRNRIEFRNYRKFGAESDITFGN